MPKGIYDRTKSKPQPRQKFFYDKEWLEKEYLKKGKSTTEIAKKLGMRIGAVNRWLVKYNIPIRNKFEASNEKRREMAKEDKLLRIDITREYLEGNKGKTINQIAAEFGISWDTVRRRIIRWNLGIRDKDIKGIRRKNGHGTRLFQKLILRHYGYKCAICGYDKFVNCCHIKRRAYGGKDTIENGIVLCPNHHCEFDNDLISVDKIKKYQVNKEKVRHSK